MHHLHLLGIDLSVETVMLSSLTRRMMWGATASIALILPAWGQDADTVPRIRSVTLSNAGLAEYTREVSPDRFVDGREVLGISTRISDLDDTLKSLLILGEGIDGVEIRLPSSGALDDVFAGLPFSPQDMGAMSDMLAHIPGTMVEVIVPARDGSPERRAIGKVMGVDKEPACGIEGTCPPALLLATDSGMTRVLLWEGTETVIHDPDIRQAIARGMDALLAQSAENSRLVRAEIRTDAPPTRPVVVSTVLAAPLWKTAYRAWIGTSGKVGFQAWAVIENATQEDWEDVALTLTSGSPRTLRADLYSRQYGLRSVAAPAAPRMMSSRAVASDQFEASGIEMAAPSAPYDLMAEISAGAVPEDALVGARFSLPQPVSIKAGEVLSLPFLAGDLDAYVLGHISADDIAPGTDLSPLPLAINVRNTANARLPDGVLTVYEGDKGFAGDAQVPAMEPGSLHTFSFASDSGGRVSRTVENTRRIRAVMPGGGIVRITADDITTSNFRIESPEESLRVAIDHPSPDRGTMSFSGAEAREETIGGSARVWRTERVLDAGEVWEFSSTIIRPYYEEWQVGDIDDRQLIALAQNSPDVETRTWIQKAIELRGAVAKIQEDTDRLQRERDTLMSNQERRRQLMEAVDSGTPPHARFLSEIMAGEDRLEEIDAQILENEMEMERARAEFSRHVGQ